MWGTLRRSGLDRLLPDGPKRLRRLAEALIVARVIEPAAKLATARAQSAFRESACGFPPGMRANMRIEPGR